MWDICIPLIFIMGTFVLLYNWCHNRQFFQIITKSTSFTILSTTSGISFLKLFNMNLIRKIIYVIFNFCLYLVCLYHQLYLPYITVIDLVEVPVCFYILHLNSFRKRSVQCYRISFVRPE